MKNVNGSLGGVKCEIVYLLDQRYICLFGFEMASFLNCALYLLSGCKENHANLHQASEEQHASP